jgi:hypothetical protein
MDKDYIFNLEKILEFVFNQIKNKNTESEITEVYEQSVNSSKLEPRSKSIRQLKTNGNDNQEGTKYDMIKSFMEIINEYEINNPDNPPTIGQKTVLNTLLSYGFMQDISELNTKEN